MSDKSLATTGSLGRNGMGWKRLCSCRGLGWCFLDLVGVGVLLLLREGGRCGDVDVMLMKVGVSWLLGRGKGKGGM